VAALDHGGSISIAAFFSPHQAAFCINIFLANPRKTPRTNMLKVRADTAIPH